MIILICNYMRSGSKLQVEPVPDSVRLREAENISWIKFLAHSSRILFFDKLSRFQCQCRFLQSYPTPYPALQSQLFRVFSALAQCSAGFIDVALGGLWAFITSTLPRTWPLYLSLCLSLAVSLSLSICRPRSQWRSRCLCRCRCSCRACVFFNGFLANVLGAAVGPSPSRSHEPYSIDFQLRRGLSYATTLRWPNQSFDYRATTLDSKNILQHGTIYILYTVIYSPMGQQMSERGPKITERVH